VFHQSDDSGNDTLLTLESPCFAEGTRILTERGEVPVEALRAGDVVVTHLGDPRVVRWIGRRRIDLRRHANPSRVRPIRIAAEAFPDNKPHRELRVSPDHAVLFDGVLIPAKLLVNGASILVDTECRAVTYFHVELDQHDILLAEGLAAESYLDTGNRAMFENGGDPVRLHPDFAAEQWLRETLSCAPFASAPERVEPVWRGLAERAEALGWRLPIVKVTADPDLRVMAGPRRIDPVSAAGGRYLFAIPAGDAPLRLVSRAARPCEMTPWIDEPRALGVLVRRLTVRSATGVSDIAMDGPAFGRGWWDAEWHALGPCRWTDGDAPLPATGPVVLEVKLGGTVRYPVDAAADTSAKGPTRYRVA
jgi:hypothetical protein